MFRFISGLFQIRAVLIAVGLEHDEILRLVCKVVIFGVLVQGRGQVVGDERIELPRAESESAALPLCESPSHFVSWASALNAHIL